MNLPPNICEPMLDRGLQPIYPPLIQVCRVTAGTVPGPTIASSSTSSYVGVYVSFTNQIDPATLVPRDREPCLVLDLNNLGLDPGYYICRLVGNYMGLPLYAAQAITVQTKPAPTVTNTYPTQSQDISNSTVTITGTNFNENPLLNTVTFNDGAVGVPISVNSTGTQMVVQFTTQPAGTGTLTAVVTSNGQPSGTPVAVAEITHPVVTMTTTSQNNGVTTVTITGTGFSVTPGNNVPTFNLGATGTITSATSTSLTATFTGQPSIGDLTAIITTNGVSSGSPVEVAQITGSQTFNTPGTTPWVATFTGNLRVDCTGWSGKPSTGVGPGMSGGGGGAGGDFARKNSYPVILGNTYNVVVSALGTYFDNPANVLANTGNSGSGITGGAAGPNSSIGDVVNGGGKGGNGHVGATGGGGGGGEAGSASSAGNGGGDGGVIAGGTAGTGTAGADGGVGGTGPNGDGATGNLPGGASGGGSSGSLTPTTAQAGQVVITR